MISRRSGERLATTRFLRCWVIFLLETTSSTTRSRLRGEFLTDDLGLDPERLFVSIHHSDDDADQLWKGRRQRSARSGSFAWATRTTSGRWRTRGRVVRARSSITTSDPTQSGVGTYRSRHLSISVNEASSSSCGISFSCSSTVTTKGLFMRFPPPPLTPEPDWSDWPLSSRASTRTTTRTPSCPSSRRWPKLWSGPTSLTSPRRSAFGSWPTMPGP